MPSKRFLLCLAAFLVVCGLLAVLLLSAWRSGLFRFNYPDLTRYPVRGIDVSHHQGPIDWTRISSRDFAFVFIKATEGGDHVDTRFAENWRESARTGLLRGAYHFFTLRRPGIEQAQNFIRIVPREPGMLPPVVDLEFAGNSAHRPSRHEFERELQAFTEALRAHYGVDPVFYTTNSFLKAYSAPFWRNRLWIRDVFSSPGSMARGWLFWQYSDKARIEGIRGFVDLNVFYGTFEDLFRFAVPRKTPSSVGTLTGDSAPYCAD